MKESTRKDTQYLVRNSYSFFLTLNQRKKKKIEHKFAHTPKFCYLCGLKWKSPFFRT